MAKITGESMFSVLEIIEKLKEYLNGKSSEAVGLYCVVRGRYATIDGFGKLIDLNKPKHTLDINLNDLPEGAVVEARGHIAFNYSVRGGFFPKLYVQSYDIIEESIDISKDVETLDSLLKNHVFTNIYQVLSKIPIKALLVHGQNAQAQNEFYSALLSEVPFYKNYLDIEDVGIALTDENIKNLLEEKGQNKDVIFIVRGSGSSVQTEIVGGIKSAIKVLELKVPLFVAIRSIFDKNMSWLEKVADYSFPSPRTMGEIVGRALYNTINLQAYEEDKKKLLEFSQKVKMLEEELQDKQELLEENAKLKENLNFTQSEKEKINQELEHTASEYKLLKTKVVLVAFGSFFIGITLTALLISILASGLLHSIIVSLHK